MQRALIWSTANDFRLNDLTPSRAIDHMLTDEMRYKLMRALEANPEKSQREIARELGVSLGRVNYCLQALIRKGLVKAKNFNNSNNKSAYMYLLTPHGVQQRANLAVRFLQYKIQEYESLEIEIAQIRRELMASQVL